MLCYQFHALLENDNLSLVTHRLPGPLPVAIEPRRAEQPRSRRHTGGPDARLLHHRSWSGAPLQRLSSTDWSHSSPRTLHLSLPVSGSSRLTPHFR